MVFGIAVVLSAPFGFLVGRAQPGWLNDAWQVSAVLVGLVVALIIFLLQAAASQSLRSEAVYRALVARTLLVWPVTLSLVFLGATALVARFNDSGDTGPAWAETGVLALFLLQVFAFGLVFVRLLQLVAPSGVARIVETAFADAIRRSVERKLLRKVARHLLNEACEPYGVSSGDALFAAGERLTVERRGVVHDFDLSLPKRLKKDYGFAADVHLTVQLGRPTPADAIAYVDTQLTPWRARPIRSAVSVHRHRTESDAIEVFQEALDIARRAAADGSRLSIDLAVDLVTGCVEQLPRAYRSFGVPYERDVTTEGFLPSGEDLVVRELTRFSREMVLSQNNEAARRMPRLAYQLAHTALEEDAAYLLDQALNLMLAQTYAIRDVGDESLKRQLLEAIPEFERYLVMSQTRVLEDEKRPQEERLAVVPHLARLFDFQTQVLRAHGEARDVESFKQAWGKFVGWDRHWTPDGVVDDLHLRLTFTEDPREQARLQNLLDKARRIVEARDELEDTRRWGMLQLGAWFAWRHSADALDDETWTTLLPFFFGTFQTTEELSSALSELWQNDEAVSMLEGWETGLQVRADHAGAYHVQARDIAATWATLLLLRATRPDSSPTLPLAGPVEFIAKALEQLLDRIESQSALADGVVDDRLDERIERLREALEKAERTAAEAKRVRIAEAPLSEEKIASFVESEAQEYAKHNRLREQVLRAGALTVEPPVAPAPPPQFHAFLPRARFVSGDDSVDWSFGGMGEGLARQQDASIYETLARAAGDVPVSDDPYEALVRGIIELRQAGYEPDVVLVPSDPGVTWTIHQSPHFTPASRGLLGGPPEIGQLAGVPVFDIGPDGADVAVAADLAKALSVEERRGSDRLFANVRPIDDEYAHELVRDGRVQVPEGKTDDEIVRNLTELNVEVWVGLDYQVELRPDGAQAVRAVRLPPESDGEEPA